MTGKIKSRHGIINPDVNIVVEFFVKKKAALSSPNPTHKLRPIVRGQTNKYNTKIKLGRGFTVKELKEAGIHGLSYARSLGIAIDLRRKDTSKETLDLNAGRIKEYISRMILYPRK